MFAAAEVWRGRPTFGIATSRAEQAFLTQDPRFAIAPYVGKHGWVTVWLDTGPEWPLLEALLRKAHARVLAKAAGAGRPRARRKAPAPRVRATTPRKTRRKS
jgi:predicted DNA-binding protein (MmcQ/YjbR family)